MGGKKPIIILKALADETRLKILELLLDGERCVCEIFPKVNRTQSTVSIQLATLEKAGLIKSRKEGKSIYYGVINKKVRKILKIVNDNYKAK